MAEISILEIEKKCDYVTPDGMVKKGPEETAHRLSCLISLIRISIWEQKESHWDFLRSLKEVESQKDSPGWKEKSEVAASEQNTLKGKDRRSRPCSNKKRKRCTTRLAGIEFKYIWMPLLILFRILIPGANGQGVVVELKPYRYVSIATNETIVATEPVSQAHSYLILSRSSDYSGSYECTREFVTKHQNCNIVTGEENETECEGLRIFENETHTHLTVDESELAHDNIMFCILVQVPGPFHLYPLEVSKKQDQDIDECASSPCVNGGMCVDGHDSYTCNCAKGYNGANCEIDIAQQEFPRNITKAPNKTIDATDLVPIPAPDCTYWKKAFDIVVPLLCLLCVILVIGYYIRERLRNKLMERVLAKVPDEDPDTTALDNLDRTNGHAVQC